MHHQPPAAVPAGHRPVQPRTHAAGHGDAKGDQGSARAHGELNQRQQRGFAQIEIKPERLIDRQFNGCGAWTTAKGKRDGKGRQADQKNHQKGARHDLAQHGAFQGAGDVAGFEPQGRRQTKALGGNGQPALQDQTCRQGQIKEHMRDDDPMQAIDVNRL